MKLPELFDTVSLRFLLGAVLVAVLAACGDGSSQTSGQRNPSTPAAADGSRTAEQAAVAAYLAMWRAYADAGLTANADAPELASYASGRALQTLRNGLASYRSKEQVIKGEFRSSPRVANVSPSTDPRRITITDCLDGTSFLVYNESGGLADDKPGGRRSTTATVEVVQGGLWKVTGFAVREVGTC